MLYGKRYPLSKTTKSKAVSIRSTGASGDSSGLAIVTYKDLRIMVWNIANLGGGFGYPAERDDAVIKAIADAIAWSVPDIVIVLEVKRFSQPPARPKIYPPRDVRVPRGLFSSAEMSEIDDIARRFQVSLGSPTFVPSPLKIIRGRLIGSFVTYKAFHEYAGLSQQRQMMIDAICIYVLEGIWNETSGATERQFDQIKGQRAFALYTGDIPDYYVDYYFDEDTTFGELCEMSDISRWFHEIDEPRTDHLPRFDANRVTIRYRLIVNIQARLLLGARTHFAKTLHGISREPTDEELGSANSLFDTFYANKQFQFSDADRRERLYQQKRAAWEASREKTKHPGVSELLKIRKAINDYGMEQFDCWPATDKAEDKNVDGGTTELSVSEKGLASQILYTEGETYGAFFIPKNGEKVISLKRVTRAGGYRKRAPFVFQFELNGKGFNVVAWHAPSNSANNSNARETGFQRFATLPQTLARTTMHPTITVGDFNIDTASSVDIRNSGRLAIDADDLFRSMHGNLAAHKESFFWDLRTSLKRYCGFRSARNLPHHQVIDRESYEMTASAYDKIVPYFPSCIGWETEMEVVIPLPYLLAASEHYSRLIPPSYLGGGNALIGSVALGLYHLPGMLDSLSRQPQAAGFSLAGRLLSLTRLMSDHLPIMTAFRIPSTGHARSFEASPMMLAISVTDPVGKDALKAVSDSRSYKNVGGGDCLYHAVLHRLSNEQKTALGIGPADAPDAPADQIQVLRNLAGEEIRLHPGRYNGFLTGGQTIPDIVTLVKTMQSWNNFGGDLAPLAIANAIRLSFKIYTTATDTSTDIVSATAPDDEAEIDPLNYNGFDHYW